MAKRRKRGDGGVSLRKDGRWEGRVVVGYDDKSLPVTKNVLARSKSDCIAKVKNCVLMQDTVVEEGASLEYIISDKNVSFTAGKELRGSDSFPVYVAKHQTV